MDRYLWRRWCHAPACNRERALASGRGGRRRRRRSFSSDRRRSRKSREPQDGCQQAGDKAGDSRFHRNVTNAEPTWVPALLYTGQEPVSVAPFRLSQTSWYVTPRLTVMWKPLKESKYALPELA